MIVTRSRNQNQISDTAAITTLTSRSTAVMRQRWGRARASFDRFVIRGQLGPSVGYAHDRRPEPPF